MRRRRLAPFVLAFVLAGAPLPAGAQNRTLDEQTFREFEQIVADFSTAERIQAWEAFLQKYPATSYAPQVKKILAELRGDARPTPAPRPTPGGDPDLDFLDEPAPAPTPGRPRPTPRPASTPRPIATPAPEAANPFMDAGTGRPRNDTASADRFSWGDRPGLGDGARANPATDPMFPDRRGGISRPPRSAAGVGKATHTEVGVVIGFAPDETYVRNVLLGLSASQRFGRTWGVSVEAVGAAASETRLLRSLRNLGAEPEVISKYNFIAGGSAEANVLSAIDRLTGQIPNRNDLYVRAGGGIVNTDLEICKEEPGGQTCAAPLFINGVNFGYATAGIGHRFYLTRWLTFRSEARGRMVFELIDGRMTPRTNVQINLGPTFVF